MKYKNIEASQLTMTQLMLPSHSNFSGFIHGGYVLDLMDQVAFACASKHSGHYCVTASVNKVDFLNAEGINKLHRTDFDGRRTQSRIGEHSVWCEKAL
jgi:acyl-CoA hydrolase